MGPPSGASRACALNRVDRLSAGSQRQVKPQRVIESAERSSGDAASDAAHARNRHCAHLFCLGFAGLGESRFCRREKHLKRMHLRGIRGHRHDRDHPVSAARSADVRCRVADNDCGTSSRCFGSDGWIKIDKHDVPASQRGPDRSRPWETVGGCCVPGVIGGFGEGVGVGIRESLFTQHPHSVLHCRGPTGVDAAAGLVVEEREVIGAGAGKVMGRDACIMQAHASTLMPCR